MGVRGIDRSAGGRDRNPLMKVLFLTKEYSPVGLACLNRLIHDDVNIVGVVTIAQYYKREGWKRAIRRYVRHRGIGFVFQRALLTANIRIRLLFKQMRLHHLLFYGSSPLHVGEVLDRQRVQLVKTSDVNSREFLEHAGRWGIDLIITCDFSQILKSELLRIPKIGCINVHTSLLPQYRGPAPVFWALYFEEEFTGVSIHWTTDKVDGGDILFQRKVPILLTDEEKTLEMRLAQTAASGLSDLLRFGDLHKCIASRQTDKESSYFKEPSFKQRKQLAKKIRTRKSTRHVG